MKTTMSDWKISSDGTTVVSNSHFWIRVSSVQPPEGKKVLVANEAAGVAAITTWPEGRRYWTHWAPFPRFVKEEDD